LANTRPVPQDDVTTWEAGTSPRQATEDKRARGK
jgi:hypothetical protein